MLKNRSSTCEWGKKNTPSVFVAAFAVLCASAKMFISQIFKYTKYK